MRRAPIWTIEQKGKKAKHAPVEGGNGRSEAKGGDSITKKSVMKNRNITYWDEEDERRKLE